MIGQADVVVENFRVGAMAALGLDYERLSTENPGLIYCSITGYGQTGPYRERAGYDAVIEAEGGLMSVTGPGAGDAGDGHPYKVGIAIVDITAGLNAVVAILAALHHRQQTGKGQAIDIALLDTQISWLANVASGYLVSGHAPKRYGNGHPSIVPYQTLRAADGWLMVGVGNDLQFRKFCALLNHPEWAEDQRFATNQARVLHRGELLSLIEAPFASAPVALWSERLNAAGIPCGPVNDIPTALADPHVRARGMVQTIEHPSTGSIPLIGPAPKLSATPAAINKPPPLLGEHTAAVLREWLGYTDEQIEALSAAGVT
jgi:crotonobetainyl-CoA:carnitine CoA-transferase CaiB-like acyl-CoA transferase